MAPSTPPPPSSDELAAFTIASTANLVMSDFTARNSADMFAPPLLSVTLARRLIPDLFELTAAIPLRPARRGELSAQAVEQRHVEGFAPKIHRRCPFIAGLMITVSVIVLAVRASSSYTAIDEIVA